MKIVTALAAACVLATTAAPWALAQTPPAKPSPAERIQAYEKAIAKGDTTAMVELGGMYFTGNGVAKDQAKALQLWRTASAQSSAMANFVLALAYLNGDGVPQDRRVGASYLARANRGFYGPAGQLVSVHETKSKERRACVNSRRAELGYTTRGGGEMRSDATYRFNASTQTYDMLDLGFGEIGELGASPDHRLVSTSYGRMVERPAGTGYVLHELKDARKTSSQLAKDAATIEAACLTRRKGEVF